MSKYFHNNTKLLILSGVLAGALVFSPALSSLALAEGTQVTEATAQLRQPSRLSRLRRPKRPPQLRQLRRLKQPPQLRRLLQPKQLLQQQLLPAPPQQMTMAQLSFVIMILRLVGILELTLLSVHTALNTTEMPGSLQLFQTIIRVSLLMEIFIEMATRW